MQPASAAVAQIIASQEGALVTFANIIHGSPAEKAGLKRKDVMTGLNGEIVKDGRDLSRSIATVTPGQSMLFNFRRSDRDQTVSIEADIQRNT
jgi:serine protease Do